MNQKGELGRGAVTPATDVEPGKAKNLPVANLAVLRTGDRFACALLRNGELYCWGENRTAQQASSNFGNVVQPTLVDVTRVCANP
jgi:alpha-tubulin suppressor-like RCC1 family protein